MPTLVNKPRILVVEDEAIVARDIQSQLLGMGYASAGHATRAEQAIAMIGEQRPDLVLMDIQLAGAMDGITAAEVIRAQYAVPVVFLTAFASDDLLARAKLAEPFGYVLKPFSERELRSVLEMALYKHQAESKLRENEARFRTLVDWSPEAIAVHRDGILLYVNPAAIRMFGAASATDLLGKHLRDRVHPDDHSGLQARLDDVSTLSGTSPMVRHRLLKFDGVAIDTEIHATSISYDGAPARHLMIRDITVRKRAEQWQQHYADTLGMILAEAPIAAVLESLVRFAERQGDGMLCSILAINGVEIGPDAGSRGAAAQAGLRPCWSLPIVSSGSKVLGTFAVYRDEPSSPDEQERELIQQSSALAAVALEHAQHQEDRRLAKVVFEQSIEGIMVTDSAHRILMVNESFELVTGYSAAEVVGLPPNILDSGHYDPSLHQMMNESMADSGRWRGELWGRKKTGDIYPLSMSVATARGSDGAPSHFINIIADISDSKVQAARIEQLAFYDTLSGLPNRALFLDRLEQILANSKRHGGHGVILFLDLDRFKEINDSQGHAVGDLALAEVARRLQAAVRKEETLARLGGDEFVLIAESADHNAAVQIAGRLRKSLLEPLDLLGNAFSVGASIGIAFYPADGTSTEDLLKHTDIAMYRAKVGGGGGYRLYQPAMGDELEKRLNVAHRLARAIETGALQLYYQPQIDLADNRVIGAEALLRWNDPLLGWISPGEFIPIAEERGMMSALGDWVLTEACRQINAWAEAGLHIDGKLAINVSARQLEAPGMVERMLDIVRAANLKPEYFELEITESTMMVDPERAVKMMEWLSAEGFALSIDDFGTGYSSLAYLKRFAVSQIKIDISFVRSMLTDANDYAIVNTIIAMARSLGLHTTAEGVEEAEQAAALRALGCNFGQGYYFGRPEPAEDFMQKWLR